MRGKVYVSEDLGDWWKAHGNLLQLVSMVLNGDGRKRALEVEKNG
jgi:hypothetical protein